jgi:carbon storage regulator CsrA
MLVLTRRTNEKIIFAGLGISVEIVRVAGNVVRVGIEAPPDVKVWRGEIAPEGAERIAQASRENETVVPTHRVRNQLNAATLALFLAQQQCGPKASGDVDELLTTALDSLHAIERDMAEPQGPPAPAPVVAGRQYRVLLVEDNANESELLAGCLRMCGHRVEVAGDGYSAMDRLRAPRRPDVVLLDMLLPRQDGASTVAAIRSDPALRGLKVFAVSGLDEREARLPRGAEGVDRWFTKPVDPRELVAAMDQDLARGSHEAHLSVTAAR